MKRIQIPKVVALIVASAFAIVCAHAQTPAPSAAALEPIAFLTAHEWDAKLPDSPDGTKKKIHARFTWTQNRQAVRISNDATNRVESVEAALQGQSGFEAQVALGEILVEVLPSASR